MTAAARLRWLRYLGVAATALLATAAYLSGARPGAAPADRTEALIGTGTGFRVGLLAYVAGLALLGWAWWRLGALLRTGTTPSLRQSPTPPLRPRRTLRPRAMPRWVLVTGALWAAPLLVAPPLGSRDVYAYACQGAVWLDGHDPYAVGAAGGGCPWLPAVPDLWHDTTAPYGPVALLASAAAVGLARWVAGTDSGQLLVAVAALRAVAVAGAVLVAACGPRLARACGVPPATAAWLGLVTPLVALHVVAGAHNDALVAGLVVAGLSAAASRRAPCPGPERRRAERGAAWSGPGRWVGDLAKSPVAIAGVVLGLAVAVKVTAVAALPFALLLARRRWPEAAGAAVAGFGAVTLATGLGLGWLAALTGTGAVGQWSSLPTGLGMAVGYALWPLGAYDTAVSVVQMLGVAVLVVFSAVVLVRAWHRRDDVRAVVAGCGTVLAAVVVLGPVVYPWYAVTPLAVLAAAVTHPRVRAGLAVATLVFAALVLPSGLGVPVLTKLPGAIVVAAGAVLVSWWWLRHRAADGHRWPPRRAPRAPAR